MTMTTYYPKIGSVSEGTLRTKDLLDTFASELAYHIKRMRLTREQRKRFNGILRDYRIWGGDCNDTDAAIGTPYDDIELTDLLQDALNEIAAPYTYFGTSDGDGACFGFWPAIDMHSDELPRLVAGDPIPHEHWGEDVLLVNDHGNVECGHVSRRGKFTEYWSCV